MTGAAVRGLRTPFRSRLRAGVVVVLLALVTGFLALMVQAALASRDQMGGRGDMSGMPMMGMMASSQDPKSMGRMLQMRGEMLKAMGDIMLKHGKEMADGQKP